MADGNAAAIFMLFGLLADIEQIEVVRARREIEMHIDVDVELARHLEDTIDLAVRA
jgi:hypothetical protein